MIDKFQLLSGQDIEIEGIATFRQPKLKDIQNIGLETYFAYISILNLKPEQYLTSLGRQDLIPKFKENNWTMLDIYKANEQERIWFIKALSFFIVGEITFDGKHFSINNTYPIENITYQGIIDIIGEIGCFKSSEEEVVYASEKARQIAEHIKQAKEKRKNTGDREEGMLYNIISAVACKHPSINLLNIWDLTVYQLYDQYQRLFVIDNFNIGAMNYAYYGGDLKLSWSKPLN
jgi:hypothetical protein